MNQKTPDSKLEISTKEVTIPVVAEQIDTGTKKRVTGRVRVHKTVHPHDEVIEQPLHREDVEVRRVLKNEIVNGPLPIRQSGDITIVPVVKEVLKIEKQWVLTEELHIVKRSTTETSRQSVTVLSEQADVQRIDAEGRVIDKPELAAMADRAAAVPPPGRPSDQPFTDRLRARSRDQRRKT